MVKTCLYILECSNRLVTFAHVLGTVDKCIGGGNIALQLKERRKSEKVSIPPPCVDTAGICNVSSDFSHPGLILTCLPQVLVLVQPLHAVQRWALSATIAETAVD